MNAAVNHKGEIIMKLKKRGNKLHMQLDIFDEPKLSKSGKTMLVASSKGSRRTKAIVHGHRITAAAICYFKPDKSETTEPKRTRSWVAGKAIGKRRSKLKKNKR
jgi:hypothetical protein